MNNIIACIDGSVVRDAVCDGASWVANRLSKPLLLLHTLEKQQQHGADDLSGSIGLGAQSELLAKMAQLDQERGKLALQLGRSLLDTAATRAAANGVESVETRLRHGNFVEELVALEGEARLMVVGKTGLDHGDQLRSIGSHIETLIRQVHTSVLIAPQTFRPPARFMLAYDGRDTANRSLDRIISGGLLTGLDCHLVMVRGNSAATEERLEAAADRLRSEGFPVTTALLDGDIYETLQSYKQDHDIDLMIMGAFAHSKVRHLFLGSNTLRMIERTDIPLIVLR